MRHCRATVSRSVSATRLGRRSLPPSRAVAPKRRGREEASKRRYVPNDLEQDARVQIPVGAPRFRSDRNIRHSGRPLTRRYANRRGNGARIFLFPRRHRGNRISCTRFLLACKSEWKRPVVKNGISGTVSETTHRKQDFPDPIRRGVCKPPGQSVIWRPNVGRRPEL